MKFKEIYRFELAYQCRRLSTWVYFWGLFAFGLLIMASGSDTFLNSPSMIALFTVMGGVGWLLLAGSVAGDAAARDAETRMDPITYTLPTSKAEYLGGRFLAALTINAAMLLALEIGMLLSLLFPLEPELIGPFVPAGHFIAYFAILVPLAFVATAIQFRAALFQRRAIAGYLASVLLLIFPLLVGTTIANQLDVWTVAELFDLIGFVNILRQMESWTPLELNTRLVGQEAMFLVNRAVWIGVALATIALTYRGFRFAHHTAKARWFTRIPAFGKPTTRQAAPIADTATAVHSRIAPPDVRRDFGVATYGRQTLAFTFASFRTIVRSRTGLTVVAILALGSVFSSTEWLLLMSVIQLLPRTEEVLGFFTPGLDFQTLWIVIPLLIIFYSGELIWHERDAGMSEIVDTSPVPEWVLFLGNFLGLALVIIVWMAFLMASGMLIQVYLGYPVFNIPLYLKALFGFQLADYLLFALVVMVVHTVVDQKYLGYGAALTAYGLIVFASSLGIEHKLLIYGSDLGWSYSPMRGFGPSVGPWLWFKLYWAAWALLLAVAARLFLARGRESGVGARIRIARQRFTPATARVTMAAATTALGVGGFIFYNTNVLNAYRPGTEVLERRAEYERRYGQYEGIAQPRLTGTNLRVEIYPARRAVDIRGSHFLVNGSAAAIDTIHVAEQWEIATTIVGFDRPATHVVDDHDFGHHVYALEKPLAPGESLRLDFEVHSSPHGFSNTGIDTSVVANGTYFKNDWLPAIGYQEQRELSGVADRRLQGLPPRPELPSLYDNTVQRERTDYQPIDVETVVGTGEDETAIAPGLLRRAWNEHGRRYFQYATDVPIGNEYAIFSARYALHEVQWKDSGQAATIQIFHHPAHTRQLERMARSAQNALSYYARHFGPYPFSHVRLIEHPGPGKGMHIDGNNVDYMEGFSLLNPKPDRDVDLPYHIVAHEMAHQWWGAQLQPAYVEGAGVLVEGLATYSAMLVGEANLGAEHLRRYLYFVRWEYHQPRSPAMPPLLEAADSYLNYRKGPLALYALGEYIGQERVRDSLRSLLQKHGPRRGQVTSLDLYRELKAVTPESSQWLLHDLFEKNTFWDLETKEVKAEKTAAGEWQVTLEVEAGKSVIDEAGIETEIAMDDWIEVGVYGEGNEPIYLQKHRLRSGKQTITVTVPVSPEQSEGGPKLPEGGPARAGIDPRYLLVDWEMEDNVKAARVQK